LLVFTNTGGFTPSHVYNDTSTDAVVVPLVEAWKLKFQVPVGMVDCPIPPLKKEAITPSAETE
jgi:hypothetical protein